MLFNTVYYQVREVVFQSATAATTVHIYITKFLFLVFVPLRVYKLCTFVILLHFKQTYTCNRYLLRKSNGRSVQLSHLSHLAQHVICSVVISLHVRYRSYILLCKRGYIFTKLFLLKSVLV